MIGTTVIETLQKKISWFIKHYQKTIIKGMNSIGNLWNAFCFIRTDEIRTLRPDLPTILRTLLRYGKPQS